MCLCALASVPAGCGSSGSPGRGSQAAIATSARAPAPAPAARAARSGLAPASCASTVVGTLAAVARRIYDVAATGEDVAQALARVHASASLAAAVTAREGASASADLRALMLGQIVRIEVLEDGRVLASAGKGPAMAPVRGSLAGTHASFVLSVQPDRNYVQVTRQLTGAQLELSSERGAGHGAGGWVAGSIGAPGNASIPASGTISYAGVSYEVASLEGESFPSGRLRIALLVPGARAACAVSATQARVTTLGRVGEMIYEQERSSPQVTAIVHLIERSQSFEHAVAERSAGATRRAIVRFFEEHLHVVRVRVTVGGRLLVDVGGPYVLAPVHGVLREGGRSIGEFEMAIQDDAGYVKLARLFTGAQVLMRVGSSQLMGSLSPGPARVPKRGRVSYERHTYEAYSFSAQAFPSGPLRISLLIEA